jgi:DNA-binding CsgD family transcriptional regulator
MYAAFPADADHNRMLGRLTLQLLDGHPEDVLAVTDRLIGAIREAEHPSEARDLRILRSLAELDLGAGDAGDRAPAAATALHFAQRIFPKLARQLSMGSISPVAALTPREIEIVALTARGFSNQEIARQLWISEQTVKKHQSNLFRKLDVRNRTEAVTKARHFGLLP